MNYNIQTRSDFKAGTELLVYIPEAELDRKALYTILNDRPSFILPFRHRTVDGQIEFTYQVGRSTKLNYLSGNRSPAEYAQLWVNLLQPLLDCDDWFMDPHCFVLQADYLYCDKATMAISYVYIPTLQSVSDQDVLKSMVTEVARQNRVTDPSLENRVIWSIQDFNIQSFLQIIKPYLTGGMPGNIPAQAAAAPHFPIAPPPVTGPAFGAAAGPAPGPVLGPGPGSVGPGPVGSGPVGPGPVPKPAPGPAPAAAQAGPGPKGGAVKPKAAEQGPQDILIQLPEKGKPPKEKKSGGGLFKKKEKIEKPPQEKGGFWGKKNNQIMQGAASQPVYPGPSPAFTPAAQAAPVYVTPEQEVGVTQLFAEVKSAGPHFRYVGSGKHPAMIVVPIQPGEPFIIGRFDVSVGVKQASFEFEGRTKAVSRRHAAIERSAAGYSIVDLDSRAGTFLNGQKLPPNAPFALEFGCRVSFGNAGADYIWEP